MNKLHYKTMAHSVPCKAGEGYVHFDGKEAECVICNPIEPPAMNTNHTPTDRIPQSPRARQLFGQAKAKSHTPLPWRVGMKPGPILYGPQGEQIASMHVAMVDVEENKANAIHIANCVNHYPALLAALERLDRIVSTRCSPEDTEAFLMLNEARAVIAQAVGRGGELGETR